MAGFVQGAKCWGGPTLTTLSAYRKEQNSLGPINNTTCDPDVIYTGKVSYMQGDARSSLPPRHRKTQYVYVAAGHFSGYILFYSLIGKKYV